MPGVKRKQTPVGESAISKGFKKSKLATNGTTKSKAAAIDQETVTDSDPLEESNTTEHSGDDDGISGPSENGEGGVEADLPIREPKPSAWALASRVEENGAPKGAETCKLNDTVLNVADTASKIFSRSSRKAEDSRSGTKSSQAQC